MNINARMLFGMLLLLTSILLQSCTDVKCEAERQLCKWDCPKTIGISQACEQKCNFSYDLCRRRNGAAYRP
jgi:hypothetical protein